MEQLRDIFPPRKDSAMLYLILAVISSASMAIVLKIFHTQRGNRYGIILGNYLTCILLAGITLPDKSLLLREDPVTLSFGCLGGFFFVAGLVMMQSSIPKNGAALTSAFARLGLILPLFVSIVFLGERPSPRQIAGLALVFAALILINSGKEEGGSSRRPAAPLLLILTLLGCGSADGLAKIFERFGDRSRDGLYFFILFTMAALLAVLLLILEYRRTGKKIRLTEFLAGVLVGIPNYYSSTLLLAALVRLPAFLVYPCFSTGTILLVAVVSFLVFRESPGRRQRIGLALILAALILLS